MSNYSFTKFFSVFGQFRKQHTSAVTESSAIAKPVIKCQLLFQALRNSSNRILTRLAGAHCRRQFSCSVGTILGIETSCDDTGVAMVTTDARILAETVYGQVRTHLATGGIVPATAARLHADNINPAISEVLHNSGVAMETVDAVAVTTCPGMAPCLKVGLVHAKRLAEQFHKPLIPVHHMRAHALTACLTDGVQPPFLALLLSGGHSLLAVARDVDEFYLIGKGLDQSPGDTLDKCARHLRLSELPGLGDVPGGRAVEIVAGQGGNPRAWPLAAKHSRSAQSDCNFSFSGLQSAFRELANRLLLGEPDRLEEPLHENRLVRRYYPDLCASLLHCLSRMVVTRTSRAVKFARRSELLPEYFPLVVSGGVASNSAIRRSLQRLAEFYELPAAVFPPARLCTDNGVMIAWAGAQLWQRRLHCVWPRDFASVDLDARSPIGEDLSDRVADWHIPVDKFCIVGGDDNRMTEKIDSSC